MQFHCKYDRLVPLDELKPNPRNPNDHSDEQIERLAKLFDYQGIRHAIIVSNQTGLMVVGHGRLKAAAKRGMKEFPVVYQDFVDPAQEYAFMVSDNAVATWAEINMSMVNEDFTDFGPDLDTDFLGFENFGIDSPIREKEIDENLETENKCPSCGYVW